MIDPQPLPDLRELLAGGDDAATAELLSQLHPASLAEFSEELSIEETWKLLSLAPLDRQADVFSFYSSEKQQQLLDGVGPERTSQLLEAMSHDDRVDLLKRVDEETVESVLPLVAEAEREDIFRLMSFPEDTTGSVMTTDYATLPLDATVSEALTLLREQAPSSETIYYVYVVDRSRHLLGIVSLRDLIVAPLTATIEQIMHTEVFSVRADQDREEIAQALLKYDFLALPVVDEQNRLIGIVTFDDVADVLEAETTEDFQLAAAVAPLEHSYQETPAWTLYNRRVGWLLILVLVNLASAGVIATYEETLQSAMILALFLPLLIDSGGNTGSQAATLIVRSLATDEVKWGNVLLKELKVGLALGVTMALASFLLGLLYSGITIGLIVAASMLCIVVLTNLLGVLLPMLLTRLKLDPAVASSPLITTVADAGGLLVYFSIASWVLSRIPLT